MTLRERWIIATSSVRWAINFAVDRVCVAIVPNYKTSYKWRCTYCRRATSMGPMMCSDVKMYPACCVRCAVTSDLWQPQIATDEERAALPPAPRLEP